MTVLSVGGLAMPRSSSLSRRPPIPNTTTFVATPPDTTSLNKPASVCNRIIIVSHHYRHHHYYPSSYCSFIKQESIANSMVCARQPWNIGRNSLNRPLLRIAQQYHCNLQGAAKKVIPCRIFQIFKQPLRIF